MGSLHIQTNNPSPAIPSSSICADDDAIDFKNSGYVKVPTNTAFNNLFSVPSNNSSSDFAVEISFISPTNATQTSLGALFSKMDAITPGTGFEFGIAANGKIYLNLNNGTNVNYVNVNALDGKCHHIIFERRFQSGNIHNYYCFFDGVLYSIGSGIADLSNTADLYFGCRGIGTPSRYFKGTISYVRFYTRSFSSPADAQYLMNGSLPNTNANMNAYLYADWDKVSKNGTSLNQFINKGNSQMNGICNSINTSIPIEGKSRREINEICTCNTSLKESNDVESMNLNEELLSNITISPNPNNGNFSIELPKELNEEFNLLVYNINGEKIYSNHFKNKENGRSITIPNYSLGVMYLVIEDGIHKYSTSFIVK